MDIVTALKTQQEFLQGQKDYVYLPIVTTMYPIYKMCPHL